MMSENTTTKNTVELSGLTSDFLQQGDVLDFLWQRGNLLTNGCVARCSILQVLQGLHQLLCLSVSQCV